MKQQQFNINIKSPCTEKFDSFQPTRTGGFCQSCQKNVVDFTLMSDNEIIDYFKFKQNEKTCGRFLPHQLKQYSEIQQTTPYRPSLKWLSAGMVSLSLFLSHMTSLGQVKSNYTQQVVVNTINEKQNKPATLEGFTVKGQVVDPDTKETLPGINVYIKGTDRGTVTDVDGNFILRDVNDGDVLIFSFIGYTTVEVEVNRDNSSPVVEMPVTMMTCDVVLMGEVAIDGVYSSGAKPTFWQRIKAWFQ